MRLVETSWRYRRIAALGSLGWSFSILSYLVVSGADTAVNRDVVGALGMIIVGVVGVYVGGAAWDDRNRMIHGRVGGGDAPVQRDPGGEQ